MYFHLHSMHHYTFHTIIVPTTPTSNLVGYSMINLVNTMERWSKYLLRLYTAAPSFINHELLLNIASSLEELNRIIVSIYLVVGHMCHHVHNSISFRYGCIVRLFLIKILAFSINLIKGSIYISSLLL